ncbi:MAG: radical SAM protein [Candidatus Woesearchaeota archaeon]
MVNKLRYLKYFLVINTKKVFVGPYEIQLNIINNCNLRCDFCWLYSKFIKNSLGNNSLWRRKFMNLELAYKILKEAAVIKTNKIIILGEGEPLLHPNIKEIVNKIKSLKMKCELLTNGTMLNYKIDDFLVKKLDRLIVSLNAATAKSYEKITASKQFKYILNNLKIINKFRKKYKSKMRLVISYILFKDSLKEVDKIIKIAKKLDAEIYFREFIPVKETQHLACNLTKNQINEWISFSKKLNVKTNLKDFLMRSKNKNCFVEQCYMGFLMTRIKVDGKVVPCCNCYSWIIGDLKKETLHKIWFCNYKKFRNSFNDLNSRKHNNCDCNFCQMKKFNYYLSKFDFLRIFS